MLPCSDHDAPAGAPALAALVAAADAELAGLPALAALADDAARGALLHVDGDAPPHRRLRWRPLDGAHPLDALMGFTAPSQWLALGVSSTGKARRLADAAGVSRDPAGESHTEPERVRITLLLDRSGDAAALMRLGDEVVPLPGRPEGTVADACRRALGLPTHPPPTSTLGLWTLTWLDRVVEVAGGADAAHRLRTWSQAAALHPAARPLRRPSAVRAVAGDRAPDPAGLAAAAAGLADAWPWSRLRSEPAVVELPGPPVTPEVARWMDDGMFARWLLADLPGEADLLAAVHGLLPASLADDVELVVREAAARIGASDGIDNGIDDDDGDGDGPPSAEASR